MMESYNQMVAIAHQVCFPGIPSHCSYSPALAAQDTDTSFRSAKDEDDLPPLERARRRRSILAGGQTRLV